MRQVIGLICELKATSFGKNKDGIITVIDAQQQKHKVALDSTDYIKAIDAHMKDLSIKIELLESDLKIPICLKLEVWPINAGLFIPDKRLEILSNEMQGLIFESQEKGYKIKVELHGQVWSELGHTERTNLITVYFYKNSRDKNTDMLMFREIRDTEKLIQLGVKVQETYFASSSYEDLVRLCHELIEPYQEDLFN